MTEQKKPLPFTEYFQSVMDWAKKSKEQRVSDGIKRTMASQERLDELSDKVSRARATKKFLEGDFWADYMEPYLRSEAVLKPAVLRDGEPNPIDRINAEYLIGSGSVRVMTRLIAKLEQWQVEGIEAEKTLEVEAEKRKRVKESIA